MSKLTEHMSYLRGLADGLKLNEDKDSNRLLLGMLEALEDVANELEDMQERQDDMESALDDLDETLDDMWDNMFNVMLDADDEDDEDEEDDDDEIPFIGEGHQGWHLLDGDEDEDEEDSDEDDEDDEDEVGEIIMYTCPSCGKELVFEADRIDFSEDYRCPFCHRPVFPEFPEEMGAEELPEEPDDE